MHPVVTTGVRILWRFDWHTCYICGCLEDACICDEPDPARGEEEI